MEDELKISAFLISTSGSVIVCVCVCVYSSECMYLFMHACMYVCANQAGLVLPRNPQSLMSIIIPTLLYTNRKK